MDVEAHPHGGPAADGERLDDVGVVQLQAQLCLQGGIAPGSRACATAADCRLGIAA